MQKLLDERFDLQFLLAWSCHTAILNTSAETIDSFAAYCMADV